MMKFRKHTQNGYRDEGFSLIEVAIGIIILGLLIGGLFQAYNIYIIQKTEDVNYKSHDRITQALALFLQEEGRFPCPADPTLIPGDADFGKGGDVNGAGQCPDALVNAGGVSIGTVPVWDLNIPFTQISDAYDNKLTYAVTTVLADAATYDGSRGITVQTATGDQNAQFVVISHGPDQKGTRPRLSASVSLPCVDGAGDGENCDWADSVVGATRARTFTDIDISRLPNTSDPNHFDDFVTYSLAMAESTLWGMSANGSNGMNIVNRDVANVGIGTDTPTSKLHVSGGDLVVSPGSTGRGGDIRADTDISASGKVQAEGDIEAGNRVKARTFYYD